MKQCPMTGRARLVVLVILLAAAFVAGFLWRGRGLGDDTDAVPAGETEAGRTRMYYCSMHPQVRSPDPDDKCPICFMDLIPVPADDDDGEPEGDVPRLRLTERAAALMEIRTWPARHLEDGVRELRLAGMVGVDESRVKDIVARTGGYVEALEVNTPWQAVEREDRIAGLYSPAATTAMRELLLASAEGQGGGVLEAARARLIRMGVSARQVEAIEQAGDAPRMFDVVSPVSGYVMPSDLREGQSVREGDRLARIADLSSVWVNLEAYEGDVPWVRAGLAVRFSTPAWPGESFAGEVVFVEPVIETESRTARVRVVADNPDGRLKPGMLVTGVAKSAYEPSDGPPLVVPVSAPLWTGPRALVYVRVPDADRPIFEPRQVELGPRLGDVVVVREGLDEGALVVVHGQFKIDSELQLRGRPSMMAPEGDAPAGHDHGAHDHDANPDAPRLQTECPVMGGSINTDFFVDAEGYRLFVCCPGCDDAILEDPERYIEKMKADGITPYKLQTHCPVMGGAINRDFYHDHDDHRIYVCCPGCLDEVEERADAIIAEQFEQGIVFERAE